MRVLVIGASTNPRRTSYQAIEMLQRYGHDVLGIGSKEATVHGVDVVTEHLKFEDIDTVTLYINPRIQNEYYDYISELKPDRVIFNPGTENPEFMKSLIEQGIKTEEACTLVLLRTGQFTR